MTNDQRAMLKEWHYLRKEQRFREWHKWLMFNLKKEQVEKEIIEDKIIVLIVFIVAFALRFV